MFCAFSTTEDNVSRLGTRAFKEKSSETLVGIAEDPDLCYGLPDTGWLVMR